MTARITKTDVILSGKDAGSQAGNKSPGKPKMQRPLARYTPCRMANHPTNLSPKVSQCVADQAIKNPSKAV